MLKVEVYKVSHSPNYLFLTLVIVIVAMFLGVSTTQMNIAESDELVSIAFVSSSAVIMLYISILACIYINRDYASNNYRLLVGTGIGRMKVLLSKYVIFLFLGILIIVLHTISAFTIPYFMRGFSIGIHQIAKMLLYILVYLSIISTMFLLSILGRTVLKSILFNIAYLIISSIVVILLSHFPKLSIFLPVNSLQLIAGNITQNQCISISMVSLLYIIITLILAQFVFSKQEL